MTDKGVIKQVIKELKWVLEDPKHRIVMDVNKADIYTLSVSSLEKQVPKKIVNKKSSDFFGYKAHCPNCKMTIVSSFNSNNCGSCGQKIDWE